MNESASVLRDLLEKLSKENLERQVRRYPEARETFEPGFLATTVSGELEKEVIRFVHHVYKHEYGTERTLPDSWGWERADMLLQKAFGGPLHWRAALRMAEQQGMRVLLDRLAQQMQERALGLYVEHDVLLQIQLLDPQARRALAQAYLGTFQSFIGIELEHPALVVWEEVLFRHARLVLAQQ